MTDAHHIKGHLELQDSPRESAGAIMETMLEPVMLVALTGREPNGDTLARLLSWLQGHVGHVLSAAELEDRATDGKVH